MNTVTFPVDLKAFRAQLDASLATTLAARTPATAAAPVTGTAQAAQTTLEARLKDALDRGVPLDRVVGDLARQLATSVAAGLGVSVPDAIAQITSVVAQALAPPGNVPVTGSGPPPSPPASNADLARTLAANARRIVETAASLWTGPPAPGSSLGNEVNGEASRRLAGNPSDAATTARGNPAPGSTDSTRTSTTAPSATVATATPSLDTAAVLRDAAQSITALVTASAATPAAVTAATSAFASTIVAATPVAPAPAPQPRAASSANQLATTTPTPLAAPVPHVAPAAFTAAPAPLVAPAPAVTAVAALAPVAPVTTASAVVAATTAGDGKRVTVDPSALLASGGDTLLGRTLTRAVRNASTSGASSTAAATPSPQLSTRPLPATAGGAAAPGLAGDAVGAFVSRLAEALGTPAPATADRPSPADGGDAPVPTAAQAGSPDPTFAALVAPATAEAQPVLPPAPAPTLPATVPAAVDPNAIVDQFVSGAFGRVGADGSSEVRLRLHPAELGDLTVKLIVTNGDVSASVLASTPQAHDALLAGQSQLGRALADAGLKLTSFTVAQDGGSGLSGQQSPSQQRSSSDGRRTAYFGFDSEDGSDDEALSAIPAFGPPLAGGLTGGLGYNHLV